MEADAAFEIDWEGIASAAPALEGELLRPGEELEVDLQGDVVRGYMELAETLSYGYNDLEGCSEGEPPETFVDPAPPPPERAR